MRNDENYYSGNSSSTEVNRRDVSSVGSPVVGQSLCRNGKTSHKDCQEVRKLNVCDGSVCNLVEMGAHLSAGGDSGAPVFWGNTCSEQLRGQADEWCPGVLGQYGIWDPSGMDLRSVLAVRSGGVLTSRPHR